MDFFGPPTKLALIFHATNVFFVVVVFHLYIKASWNDRLNVKG